MIAMAGDLVTSLRDRLFRSGIAFGNRAAGQERRLHTGFVQDSKNSPDPGLWSVFSLGPFLMIDFPVFVRLHILATLKVKCEHDGHAIASRPADLFPEMRSEE